MFERLIATKVDRWIWTLLPVSALLLAIWYFGPRIAIDGKPILAGNTSRWWLIGAILALWLLWTGWRLLARKIRIRIEPRTSGEASGDNAPDSDTVQEDALRSHYQTIRPLLRQAASRKLPRYLILGEPGSGKSAWIEQTGLRVHHRTGDHDCSWYFSEEALFIETSSRLGLPVLGTLMHQLISARRRRPLNGICLTFDLTCLLAQDEMALESQAGRLRERLKCIQQILGDDIPVYVQITQCDRLAGFSAFFNGFTREQRAQCWGMAFPLAPGRQATQALQHFPAEFAALCSHLQQFVAERLHALPSPEERSLALGFPLQFAGIGERLAGLLQWVFAPSVAHHDLCLRGICFSSAIQQGVALQRWTGSLAPTLQPAPPRIPETRLGYFIAGHYPLLLQPEQHLAPAWRLSRRTRCALLIAGIAALILGVGYANWSMLNSYQNATRTLTQAQAAADRLQQLQQQGFDPDHAESMLALLDTSAALSRAGETGWRALAWRDAAGRLNGIAQGLYHKVQNKTLQPYLLQRLANAMRNPDANFVQRYRALRIYLMLGERSHRDARDILAWLSRDLSGTMASEGTRQSLLTHYQHWLQQLDQYDDIGLDLDLIDRTRASLLANALAPQLYAQLVADLELAMPGHLALSQMAGPGTALTLERKSGRPLSEGVASIYTQTGYERYQKLRDELFSAADQLRWVLATQLGRQEIDALKRALDALYFQHYNAAWDQLLDDVALRSLDTLGQDGSNLKLLASPDSPLRLLLLAADRQTRFAGDTPVAQHFAQLHRWTIAAPGSKTSPLEEAQARLAEAAVYVDAVNSALDHGLPPPKGDALRQLQRLAASHPDQLGSMLSGLVQHANAQAQDSARQQLNELWRSQVAEFCHQALDGRYPMQPGSLEEVSLDDFSTLFRPNGLIDGFFRKNLAASVDTSLPTWQMRTGANGSLKLSPPALHMFQQAAAIRSGFFANGSAQPQAAFTLQPLNLAPTITWLSLSFGGQSLRYAHGPLLASAFQWPASDPASGTHLDYSPAGTDGVSGIGFAGPWSLFRLLDLAQVQAQQPDRYRLDFNLQQRHAGFELRAASVNNPFGRDLLRGFTCRDSL